MFTVEYLKSIKSREPIVSRIMKKVEIRPETGCWIFKGSKDRCGYGCIKIGKHQLGAHKVAYLMLVGDYDQKNLELMHRCDNPSCVNPSHLSPGTHKENMDDCLRKGRHTSQRGVFIKPLCGRQAEYASSKLIMTCSPRKMATMNNEKTYAGSFCKLHTDNNLRVTSNGACCFCQAHYQKSKRTNCDTKSMKCIF
ncbi:TPA: HNH endonuclease [Enterobacter cloacae]|nr:hypothetical protein [Enterobacter cloacae subsp. cloacae]HDS4824155.1 HNH endonuclease [Enterobacter cloacae]HDT2257900.1 HNH endonuclease [Enterobacter cloacae]